MKKNYFMSLCLSLFTVLIYAQDVKLHKSVNRALLENAFKQKGKELGYTSDDLANWRISAESTSKNKELWYYFINQTHNGIDVYNAISNFSVRNGQEATLLNSTFAKGLSGRVNSSAPSVTPVDAVQRAASHLQLKMTESLEQLETKNENKKFIFNKAGISQEDIQVDLMYYPVNDSYVLAWNVSMFMLDGQHWWNVKIDAATGQYIDKFDYTVSCSFGPGDHSDHDHDYNGNELNLDTKANRKIIDVCKEQEALENAAMATQKSYRVLRYNIESPNHGPFTLEVNPEDLTASPLGWHSNNNTPDAFQETRGNNVRAILDNADNPPNNNGPETVESSADVYDYAYGGQYVAANTYADASVTNLFYMSNIVHDIYWLYGFEEADRNFQNNNFGNGGAGNDAIRADAQDASGTNNANFSTPADGNDGVMQMFLWDIQPQQELLTINNSSAAGGYVALDNQFAPGNVPVVTAITANLVLADDGSANPTEACNAVNNGAAMNGNIAVIRRGNCTFTSKVINAENAGAVAVLIVNNVAGEISMGGGDAGVGIPAYSINQADGEAIIAAMGGTTVNATFNPAQAGFVATDGDFDNGIIAHEYGHGINIRLLAGASVTCATGYGEGLSEGWADYIGKILFLDNVDNGIHVSGTGTFAIGEPITGAGIRPAPYSGDISDNDMTHQDMINNNARYSVPHGVGAAFAGILWDLTWDMIAIHGFEPNLYNSTSNAGNILTLRMLMESLKIAPCRPTIGDTRDSIIAADQALNGGANFCAIWSAFARRGWGTNSNSGGNGSAFDGTAGNNLPGSCTPDYIMTIGGPTDSCEGSSLQFELVFNAQNGWNTNVGFAASGLPAGASATFSPTTISDTGLVTITVNNLPAGAHNITVTPAGDTSKDIVLPINVQESNADLTDGDTQFQVDAGGYTSFNDGATIDVSPGSDLDLQLPDTAFVGTLLWTAPNGTTYTTNTVSFSSIVDADTNVEGAWSVVPTFTLNCPGSNGSQTINFTVNINATACFVPRVYLQGPYDTGSGMMTDGLRSGGHIPLTSPYGDGATTTNAVLNVTGNNAIVDWVWVELRDKNDNTSVLASTSALLQRDGDVVGAVDGTSTLKFSVPVDDYYISINHRNHLAFMTSTAQNIDASCKVVDLSIPTGTGGSIALYGTNGQAVSGGVRLMWAGDVDATGTSRFTGNANDSNEIRLFILSHPTNLLGLPSHVVTGYSIDDVNMDGEARFTGGSNDANEIKLIVLNHPGNILGLDTYVVLQQMP